MADLSPRPGATASSPARRLIAAGLIRRLPGRTLTVRATEAGVTGRIRKDERVAELHRLARADYEQAAVRRAAQNHRDDVHLYATALEAVTGR